MPHVSATARALAVTSCLGLGACAGSVTDGAQDTLGVDGPARSFADTKSTPAKSLPETFYRNFHASIADPENPGPAAAFLQDGFSLNHQNCSVYFAALSEGEKWHSVTKDAVAIVGSVTAAILAATSSAGTAAGVAVATGAGYAGLDLYRKNFLFDAEFADAVRELVMKALDAHRDQVLKNAAEIQLTFRGAADAVMDNESICMNSSIRRLVTDAVRNGKLETAGATSPADSVVLGTLGGLMGQGTPATLRQAAVLWAVLIDKVPSSPALDPILVKALGPVSEGPFSAAGKRVDWSKSSRAVDALRGLSTAAQKTIAEQIEVWASAVQNGAKQAPALRANASEKLATPLVALPRVEVRIAPR